jgi:hypothetical protein
MFFDAGPLGPHGGEPALPHCRSCRNPILSSQAARDIRFPQGLGVDDMSGTYHAECAQAFASIANALDMLGRSFG